MLSRETVSERLREYMPLLKEKFYVKRIGFFGSYARNEQSEESDIDILVEFSKPVGFEFIDLKFYLEEIFNRKVDLATIDALKPRIKEENIERGNISMKKRNILVFVDDIIEAMENIEEYIKGHTFETFKTNKMIFDAVLEI